jgi:hypothetical protein
MKQTAKMKRLLERMAQIARMERGKLCQMGGRPHYNHQTWENGRNVVRYVPEQERHFLEQAIQGYRQFMDLAEDYAQEVIEQTRREREKLFPKPRASKQAGKRGRTKKAPTKKIDS